MSTVLAPDEIRALLDERFRSIAWPVGRPARVLVTGSREWVDASTVRVVLFHTAYVIRSQPNAARPILIHGAARGLDRLADQIWSSWGLPCQSVPVPPSDWRQYGRAAGHLRNVKMVEKYHPDVCIGFPLPRSNGTRDCIATAIKNNVPTIVIEGR